jgi:hypothetical protein
MVCSHSPAGVAPGGAPKAEATELAPGAIGAGPPTAIKTRVVLTGRQKRGPAGRGDLLLLVKLPSVTADRVHFIQDLMFDLGR